jgi:hypothetical protein
MPNELDSGSSLPRVRGDATKTASSFSGALPGVYRGVIVSRDDPDKQGRVKVALPHIYGDVPVDELPWVYPITSAWPTGDTDRPAGGAVNVPPMGAPVVCMFEGGDHRYPMYIGGSFGKPGFTDTVPAHSFAANGNSPDNYSFTSPGATTVQVDDRAGTQKVIAIDPKGNYVSIAQSGLLEIKSQDTVSTKGQNMVSIDSASAVQIRGNKVLVYSTGDLVIEASGTINVNGGSTVNIQSGGNINLNCGTSSTGQQQFKEIQTQPNFDGS